MRIAITAGEPSGDLLAAGLIEAIQRRQPDACFEGIAGPRMAEAGCRVLYPLERLSVMGFAEVLGRLPSLLRLRGTLAKRLRAQPPDLFIGVDAPDFNLGLERALRRAGIPTVHYVSPSVWAWRRYRLGRIAQSVDLMLTLFPFEAEYYRQHQVPVRFVGHPLADRIPGSCESQRARNDLGLAADREIVAVLPGSRHSEVQRLAPPFLAAVRWLRQRRPGLQAVVPAATPALHERLRQQLHGEAGVRLVQGRSVEALCAADVALVASGTATLEALLLQRPMIVAYRMAPLSYQLMRRMLRVPYYSLPNNLAGEALVPEITQAAVTADNLGAALLKLLEDPEAREGQVTAYANIQQSLRGNASERAAEAVLALVGVRGATLVR